MNRLPPLNPRPVNALRTAWQRAFVRFMAKADASPILIAVDRTLAHLWERPPECRCLPRFTRIPSRAIKDLARIYFPQ